MKMLTARVAISTAIALCASAGWACDWHNNQVSASIAPKPAVVAMSTIRAPAAPVVDTVAKPAVCSDGKACSPATK